ncbi:MULTISPECIES: putative leader peptide [unclassified Streptomyces]
MRTRAPLPAHARASRSPLLTSRRHIDLLRVCSAIGPAA